ncbi:hypothetical protein [Azospirillum halopraeferens]|uniref:hypothetical protein n=1 Tax=Azospirillum halopraeferens TaxID=34010 RepID=UPI0003F98863|nr:hypothetical protein [Azospirillum halopraeferens]
MAGTRLRTSRAALAALLLGAPLAACDDSRVVADQPDPAYSFNELAYAASDRDLRVVVHGTPFGGDAASFSRGVAAVMRDRIVGIRTNPTTDPGASARPAYRVVFAFEPVQPTLNSELCGDGPVRTQAPGTTLTAQAVFCRGGRKLSGATGRLDEAQGPNDPRFRRLIGDLTATILPPNQP